MEQVPYDAKCKMCGFEHYKDDGLKECPRCGYSFAPPKKKARPQRKPTSKTASSSRSTVRPKTRKPPIRTPPTPPRRRTVVHTPPPEPSYTPPSSSSSDSHVTAGDVFAWIATIALIAGIIALIIWAWPVVSVILGIIWFLIKAIFWVICLPFKIIGWLFG